MSDETGARSPVPGAREEGAASPDATDAQRPDEEGARSPVPGARESSAQSPVPSAQEEAALADRASQEAPTAVAQDVPLDSRAPGTGIRALIPGAPIPDEIGAPGISARIPVPGARESRGTSCATAVGASWLARSARAASSWALGTGLWALLSRAPGTGLRAPSSSGR